MIRHPSSLRFHPSSLLDAFTLIEMIGVLAVIAILAVLAAPGVLRQMDEAARTKERTDLVAISNAIVLQVLSTKTIPNETALPQAAANWTRFPVSQILTNNRRYARAFLIDTNGWFGTAAGNLPYTQSTTGSVSAPVSARMLIVSTIAPGLPVATGRPGNAAFNNIWITPDGTKPTTAPWTTWAGKGEDLFIQRVNLEPIFHRLVVVNRDRSAAIPMIPTVTIDTTNTLAVQAGGAGLNAFYFDGAAVGLCDPSGTPIMRFNLTNDVGCVFEGGIFRFGIGGGDSRDSMAQDFAALAAKFLAAQWYPGASQGGRTADQQGALTALYNFMLVFELWANPFPHFNRHGANAQQVPEFVLLNDLVGSGSGNGASGFINVFTGTSGLLNK